MSNSSKNSKTPRKVLRDARRLERDLVRTSKPNKYKKGKIRRERIKEGQAVKEKKLRTMISPVSTLILGQGVVDTIVVASTIDVGSVKLTPAGLISLAYNRGINSIYGAYKVLLSDLTSLILSGNGTAPARLKYLNKILASVTPKNVPFRRDGSVAYSTSSFDTTPSYTIPTHDGFNFYMYEPSTTVVSGWTVQTTPAPTTDDEDRARYIEAMQLISGKTHNELIRNIELMPEYRKDCSFFCRYFKYYGESGGVGAPSGSAELEVPYKSKMLGTFFGYDSNPGRVARTLDPTSGDSCSNWTIGALDQFKTNFYKGAVCPFYKFIDMAEVAFLLIQILLRGLELYLIQTPDPDLSVGMGVTYTQFILMLRQQLLFACFADSQSLGQFLTFNTGTENFIAFLCGSNCCAKEPETRLKVTNVFNENMKSLMMTIHPYITNDFNNKNNHITYIPVLGMFQDYEIPVFTYTVNGVQIPLFNAETSPIPNIWDGTMGNNVVDFNQGPMISGVTVAWNNFMEATTNMYSGITTLGGESCGSPLLQFTRFVEFDASLTEPIIIEESERIPKIFRNLVTTRERVDRTNSKKFIKEKILAVPDNSPYSERTYCITGIIPITSTHKEYLPDLILPIIEILDPEVNPLSIPTVYGVQTATHEKFSLNKKTKNGSVYSTRAAEIILSVSHHVTGLAGHKSELADYMMKLSEQNCGGFVGDLFSTLGNVTNAIGIPIIPEVARTFGNIANIVGI